MVHDAEHGRPRRSERPLLTAAWRDIAMINFEVEPELLRPLVPAGTELDSWNGTCFLSLVGFMFLQVRLAGIPVPFHQSFEEVNLRFYVRRESDDGWRRAVVFVKEFVPKRAVAAAARLMYSENYEATRMAHEIEGAEPTSQTRVAYSWVSSGVEHSVEVHTNASSFEPGPDSEEGFIAEHYWGYTRLRDGGTLEYRVEHPSWRVSPAQRVTLDWDVSRLCGGRFATALRAEPRSAFVADGSRVAVYRGRRMTQQDS